MFINEMELAVLQAITDRIHTVGQWTKKSEVLKDLRSRPKTEEVFEGIPGDELFENTLTELFSECFLELNTIRGEAHVTITPDAVKVWNLKTDLLFV